MALKIVEVYYGICDKCGNKALLLVGRTTCLSPKCNPKKEDLDNDE